MTFFNPIAWWGLLGILAPLAVFLLSKRKSKIIDFSSLQFLETSEAPSTRSIRPTEWLKFLLRSLLIFLLCFMLAVPQIKVSKSNVQYYMEKAIHDSESFSGLKDGLDGQDIFVFSFDSLDQKEPYGFSSAWELIHKVNESKDSVVIYTHSLEKNFNGSPEALKMSATWVVVPLEDEIRILDTVPINGESVIIEIKSNEEKISWSRKGIADIQVNKDIYPINIQSSKDRIADQKFMQDLLIGIAKTLPFKIVFKEEGARLIVLLDTIFSVNGLQLIQTKLMGSLHLNKISSDIYEIQGVLSEEQIQTSGFVFQLANLLLDDFYQLDEINRRIVKEGDIPRKVYHNNEIKEKKKVVAGLWIPVFILLGIERWVSLKGNK